MKALARSPRRPGGCGLRHWRGRAAGFSLVELMVAMAVTLTLATGMLTLLMSTRSNNVAQNVLEQVQDDQRLVLTRLIDTVQNAGYFPNPTTSSQAIELPANSQFHNPGQSLFGSSGSGLPGDTLVVRYEAGTSDGVMDCGGSVNTSGAALVMVNSFSVDGSGNLNCTVNGKVLPLAGGVNNFQVRYGVDTNSDGSADQYLPASSMTAANWTAVISIQVTLTFNNPLAGQAGQPATLAPITQIIPVLNTI